MEIFFPGIFNKNRSLCSSRLRVVDHLMLFRASRVRYSLSADLKMYGLKALIKPDLGSLSDFQSS